MKKTREKINIKLGLDTVLLYLYGISFSSILTLTEYFLNIFSKLYATLFKHLMKNVKNYIFLYATSTYEKSCMFRADILHLFTFANQIKKF